PGGAGVLGQRLRDGGAPAGGRRAVDLRAGVARRLAGYMLPHTAQPASRRVVTVRNVMSRRSHSSIPPASGSPTPATPTTAPPAPVRPPRPPPPPGTGGTAAASPAAGPGTGTPGTASGPAAPWSAAPPARTWRSPPAACPAPPPPRSAPAAPRTTAPHSA